MNDRQYKAILMTLGRKLTNGELSTEEYEQRLTTVMAAYNSAKSAIAASYQIATDAANN